jgi:hypothetical protein
MASWIRWIIFTALLGLLAACVPPARHEPDAGARIIVLSADPMLVSGSDVRIAVASPQGQLDELKFWLNGKQIQPPMMRRGRLLESVVSGLVLGRNLLEVRRDGGSPLDSVVLVNHPITGPIFTGPQQQPFICRTEESGLGQPLVDNHDGIGHPVFDNATGRLVGHSRYCAIETRFLYFYFNGSGFLPFDPARDFDAPPADLQTTPVNGVQLPFVVRVEIGTINRFIYTIAMLAPYREGAGDPRQLNDAAWNEKLVVWLHGGGGIDHQQGLALWSNNRLGSAERLLFPPLLAQGYAIASSSGNETGVHYKIRLAEETALMIKEHFIEQYGKPRYTIGLGGSAGAVQQGDRQLPPAVLAYLY